MSWESCTSFRVYGIPKGQPRPRAFARNGKARVYDPGTAEAWKGAVAFAAGAFRSRPRIDGAVRFDAVFLFPAPKRLAKALTHGPIPHTSKPDIDNVLKATLDTLTVIGVWGDDAQVAMGLIEKWYAAPGDKPGAIIEIKRWKEE